GHLLWLVREHRALGSLPFVVTLRLVGTTKSLSWRLIGVAGGAIQHTVEPDLRGALRFPRPLAQARISAAASNRQRQRQRQRCGHWTARHGDSLPRFTPLRRDLEEIGSGAPKPAAALNCRVWVRWGGA